MSEDAGFRPVVVCDKVTMRILKEYPSVTEAARNEGLNLANLHRSCTLKSVRRGDLPLYRFKDQYDPNESFEDRYNRPVMLIDSETKKVLVFYDIKDAARHAYVSPATVQRAIRCKVPISWRYMAKYAR